MATTQADSEHVSTAEDLVMTLKASHLIGDAKRVWDGEETVLIVKACKNPPYKLRALLRDIHDQFGGLISSQYPESDIDVSYREDDKLVVYRF